jgi:hypothetical protein
MVMEIGCSCGIEPDCYPEFFNTRWPKAGKDHECCECGETIRRGEIHEYAVGKQDGDWFAYRTCITCYRIRRDYGECAAFGMLRYELWQCLGFDYVTGEFYGEP